MFDKLMFYCYLASFAINTVIVSLVGYSNFMEPGEAVPLAQQEEEQLRPVKIGVYKPPTHVAVKPQTPKASKQRLAQNSKTIQPKHKANQKTRPQGNARLAMRSVPMAGAKSSATGARSAASTGAKARGTSTESRSAAGSRAGGNGAGRGGVGRSGSGTGRRGSRASGSRSGRQGSTRLAATSGGRARSGAARSNGRGSAAGRKTGAATGGQSGRKAIDKARTRSSASTRLVRNLNRPGQRRGSATAQPRMKANDAIAKASRPAPSGANLVATTRKAGKATRLASNDTSGDNKDNTEGDGEDTSSSSKAEKAEKSKPAAPEKKSEQGAAPTTYVMPKVAKMWTVRPGQKIVISKNLSNMKFPPNMKVIAADVELTDEQREQVVQLMRQGKLPRMKGLTKEQIKKMLVARKKTERKATPSATPATSEPQYKKRETPTTLAKRPQHKSKAEPREAMASLPVGIGSPFKYKKWNPAAERYTRIAKKSDDDRVLLAQSFNTPKTNPENNNTQPNNQQGANAQNNPQSGANQTTDPQGNPRSNLLGAGQGTGQQANNPQTNAQGGSPQPGNQNNGNQPGSVSNRGVGNNQNNQAGNLLGAGQGAGQNGNQAPATQGGTGQGNGQSTNGQSANGQAGTGQSVNGQSVGNQQGNLLGSGQPNGGQSGNPGNSSGNGQRGIGQADQAGTGQTGNGQVGSGQTGNGQQSGLLGAGQGTGQTNTTGQASVQPGAGGQPNGQGGQPGTGQGSQGGLLGAGQSGNRPGGAGNAGSGNVGANRTGTGQGNGTQGGLLGAGQGSGRASNNQQTGNNQGGRSGAQGGLLGSGQGGGSTGNATSGRGQTGGNTGAQGGHLGAGQGAGQGTPAGNGQNGGQGGLLGAGQGNGQSGGQPGGAQGGLLGAGQGAGQAGGTRGNTGPGGGAQGGLLGAGQGAGQGGNQGGNQGGAAGGLLGGGQGGQAGGNQGSQAGQGGGQIGDGGAGGAEGGTTAGGGGGGAGGGGLPDNFMEGAGGFEGGGFVDSEGVGGDFAESDGEGNGGEGNREDTGFAPAQGIKPNMPDFDPNSQKGVPGALVLPPLPPIGTENGKGIEPRDVKPTSRTTTRYLLAFKPPAPTRRGSSTGKAMPRKVQPSTRGAKAVAAVRPKRLAMGNRVMPNPQKAAPAPSALTLGSPSSHGTIPVEITKQTYLPLGGQSDTVNPPLPAESPRKPRVVVSNRPTIQSGVVRQPRERKGTMGHRASLMEKIARPQAMAAQNMTTEEAEYFLIQKILLAGKQAKLEQAKNSRGIKEGSKNPLPLMPLPDSDAEIGDGSGLKGEYFSGRNFEQYQFTRADPNLYMFWGHESSPSPRLPVGADWSCRWTGKIQPRYSDTYTFYVVADDGVRLWIDHKLVIDDWTLHPLLEYSGVIKLEAGKQYDIRVDYFESGGPPASVAIYWESPKQRKEFVPQECLFYPLAGHKKEMEKDEIPHR